MASELSIEIATLQGWKDITEWIPGGLGYHIGTPPEGTNYEPVVPQPDTDPAACMELLRYVLSQKLYGRYPFAIGDMDFGVHAKAWYVRIEAMQQSQFFGEQVSIGTGDNFYGEGETLELAIATACRDALKAIQESGNGD